MSQGRLFQRFGAAEKKAVAPSIFPCGTSSSGPYWENIALSLSRTRKASGNILPVRPSRSVNKK